MNRTIHRWISFPVAIVTLVVAVTGVVLQFYEFEGNSGRGATQGQQSTSAMSQEEIEQLVSTAMSQALVADPELNPKHIELSLRGQNSSVTIAEGRRGARRVEFDARSGLATAIAEEGLSLRGLMIRLHTGRLVGTLGLVLVLLAGVALVVLTYTGFMVYLDMWKRRRAAGKKGMFW